jgi:hypothetical protein
MAESEAGAGQEELVRTRAGALMPTSRTGGEAAGSREKGQLQISDPLEHTSHQAQDTCTAQDLRQLTLLT